MRQGKGKRDRMVPIGDRAVAWVDKYLADVRPMLLHDLAEDALFLTKRGESLNPDQLSPAVAAYVDAAGVGKGQLPPVPAHLCHPDAGGRR